MSGGPALAIDNPAPGNNPAAFGLDFPFLDKVDAPESGVFKKGLDCNGLPQNFPVIHINMKNSVFNDGGDFRFRGFDELFGQEH